MLVQRSRPPQTGLLVVVALLGSLLLSGIHSARAQDGTPAAAYPAGTAVDVGDSWQLTVGAVTIHTVSPDAESTPPPALLATSLVVQNVATQPRSFPTYRLHLTSATGVVFQDTWCRDVDQSLELAPEIPPNGTATGALCWRVQSADTAQVVLAWDPAVGSADQRVVFALDPIMSAESRIVPARTPSPAPLLGAIGDATGPGRAGLSGPSGAPCGPSYSLNADSSGSYSTLACGARSYGDSSGVGSLGWGARPCQLYPSANQPSVSAPLAGLGTPVAQCPTTGGGASWNAGVSSCQLYPSASQPSSSSSTGSTALGTGAPLTAAISAAPPCPLAGGGGVGSINGGAPACRLYYSGSQPSTSTYGQNIFPVLTPVAAPTVAVPPGGALAGSSC